MCALKKELPECIGLIPAAGRAKRLSPLPCSKEILPIGFEEIRLNGRNHPKVSAHYLLEQFSLAGAERAYMILSKGKWDIPSYFGSGRMVELAIGYLITEWSYGVPFTLDSAFPFLRNKLVLLGFPDILIKPDDVYVQLLERYQAHKADIVLGLFAADNPKKMDMVELGAGGNVRDIRIKPSRTNLKWTWITAVWNFSFTQFMHDWVDCHLKRVSDPGNIDREFHLGDVIRAAIQADLKIETVFFGNGEYIDIGSPEDLAVAVQRQASGQKM